MQQTDQTEKTNLRRVIISFPDNQLSAMDAIVKRGGKHVSRGSVVREAVERLLNEMPEVRA